VDVLFRPEEQVEVVERLDQIKDEIRSRRSYDPAVASNRAGDRGIEESSEKISRKDWKLLLYGKALDLGFTYAKPAHVGVVQACHCPCY
jgi:hypothetical protein